MEMLGRLEPAEPLIKIQGARLGLDFL